VVSGWIRQGGGPEQVGISQRIVGLLGLLALAVAPAWASDQVSLNSTDQTGVMGVLLAAPPGSCTAVPGGTLGDCLERGEAATAAAASSYFDDTTWSDLKEADVPLTENGNTEVGLVTAGGAVTPGGSTPQPDTDMGHSWVVRFCDRPQCGHLLRGDTLQFDENGDGKFDDTWIDKNFNNVIDNGEIDRTRGEQFGWGITSVTRKLGDLGDQLSDGNLFPAGLARSRVRMALGDASQVGTCDARVDNPDCLDNDPNPPNVKGVDSKYWARCDPDKFVPDYDLGDNITTLAEGQEALDNCLWWLTSLPIDAGNTLFDDARDAAAAGDTPTFSDGVTPLEIREIWIDQSVFKPVFSSTPDAQDFGQSVYVTYGFEKIPQLDEARYENGWQLLQQDRDPNEDVNGNINPYNGSTIAAPSGPAVDTYPYAFAIEHSSLARARGEDNDGNLVAECPDTNCDGKTNPTVDPFWRQQMIGIGLEAWDTQFEYIDGQPCGEECRGSGIGAENGFSFLTAQDVNGYFESCIGCQPNAEPLTAPPVEEVYYMPYQSSWSTVPTIVHAP
jgi:hypothetical protein